jgi:hypothetical protein
MADEFDIPDEARAVKPWFSDHPREIVPEIREWIRGGNWPHLWRGHTHTQPPADAYPLYVGEFDLAHKLLNSGRFAPCPCCSPKHAKYGRGGKVAWFPAEKVIRLIGPRCFASLNADGHAQAEATFRREKRAAEDTAYLLANLDKVGPTIYVFEELVGLAEAIDQLRLRMASDARTAVQSVWQHSRGGLLYTVVSREEVRRLPNGDHQTVKMEDLNRYAEVAGAKLFDPQPKPLLPRVSAALRKLKDLEIVYVTRDLEAMDDHQKNSLAKRLGRAMRDAADLRDELVEIKLGYSPQTLATLRTWGQRSDAPTRFYIRRHNGRLAIGRDEGTAATFDLHFRIDGRIQEIPRLTVAIPG